MHSRLQQKMAARDKRKSRWKILTEDSVFVIIGQFNVLRFPLNRSLRRATALLVLLYAVAPRVQAMAEESPFPTPAGLEGAVDFWNRIFTRYGADQVVLFDPLDPGKIYSVVRADENEQGRALVEKERAKIAVDYGLADDETRIRSQRGAKENFLSGLKISGRYLAQMQNIFREEGLPTELAYLPLVESSFNIRARSSVGAVGMWQFMPETGKKFMRIDATVDERRDPMASTRAAARLLKENYRILGSWPLAITAYNHGTEGMFRGIKAVESDDLTDLIRRFQSPTFGFASKNFYAEFLAVLAIASNSEKYFPFLRTNRPVTLDEVEIKRQAALQAVLKPAAISQRDFFDWNPALNPAVKIIPVGYRVKLPPDKVDEFVAAHKRAGMAAQSTRTPAAGKATLRKAVRPRSTSVASSIKVPRAAVAAANVKGRAAQPPKKRAAPPRTQLRLAAH